jgi:hypothetical protein
VIEDCFSEVGEERLLAEGQHSHAEIGEMFRVTKGAVKGIKYGKTWAWLE